MRVKKEKKKVCPVDWKRNTQLLLSLISACPL